MEKETFIHINIAYKYLTIFLSLVVLDCIERDYWWPPRNVYKDLNAGTHIRLKYGIKYNLRHVGSL